MTQPGFSGLVSLEKTAWCTSCLMDSNYNTLQGNNKGQALLKKNKQKYINFSFMAG